MTDRYPMALTPPCGGKQIIVANAEAHKVKAEEWGIPFEEGVVPSVDTPVSAPVSVDPNFGVPVAPVRDEGFGIPVEAVNDPGFTEPPAVDGSAFDHDGDGKPGGARKGGWPKGKPRAKKATP